MNLTNIMKKGGKASHKGYILYDSLYIKFKRSKLIYISHQQTFSVKEKIVNILDLVSHKVSISTTQIRYYDMKTTREYKIEEAWLCFNKTIYQKKKKKEEWQVRFHM